MIMKESEFNYLINKFDAIKKTLVNSDKDDDLYYDTIKAISHLKISSLQRNIIEINDLLIEMGKLNFSKRLSVSESESILNYFFSALNFLNEELEQKIIPRHDTIIKMIKEFVIVTDSKGIVKFCNNQFSELLELAPEQLKNKNIFDFIMEESIVLDLKKGFSFTDVKVNFRKKYNKPVPVIFNIKELTDEISQDYIFIGKSGIK
jgi:transcriptional regulator with PAS, ATPase and Fis domain